jgi:DNA-binding response OmpR family regulator/cytochrome c-type biogenesis protein CcmH/NrfG
MSQHTSLPVTPATPSKVDARQQPLVLVIDPNDTARSVLEVALGRDGFEVVSAVTGAAALELVKARAPDVVVLESDLGTEDGFSFVAQLRGSSATARVPVLLLARVEDRNVEALADIVGVDEFIQKPAYARDVVSLVRLELARREHGKVLTFKAAELPAPQLLRALLTSPRSGRLTLAEGRATVSFRNGRVVDVRFDRAGDVDALVRALALTTTTYEVSLEPVEGFAEVQIALRELVNVVLPRLARYAAVQARSLPLGSKLVVDFQRLASTIKSMPDGINQVTQLFDGFRTLQDVIAESPYTETITLEIATRLYLMGVVMAVRKDEHVLAPTAPKLFEPKPDEAVSLMNELFDGAPQAQATAELPSDQGDWFEEPHGSGLEVLDASGGWLAGAPTELTSSLPDDLQAQLDAFNIQIEVEAPVTSAEARELGTFVRGEDEPIFSTAIEQAVANVAAAQLVVEPVKVAAVPQELAPEFAPTPPSAARAQAAPQASIVTPLMTPMAVAAPAPAVLEDAFFGTSTMVEEPMFDEAPVKKPRAVWPVVLIGLGILVVAVLGESLFGAPRQAPTAAPVPAPVVAAPVVAPVEPVAAPVEEAAVAEPTVDVSDNLVEARKLYESGQYPRAVSVLEQVLADAPTSADAWMLMGLVRYDAGEGSAAKAAAEKVLSLDAKNARVHILLASMAFDAGDRDLGKAELQKYLDLDPSGQHADEARALLKR